MTAPIHPERKARRFLATSRVAVTVSLVVALVGLALPYGASTPGDETVGLTPLEWALSVLGVLAAIGLLLDLFRPLHPRLKASGVAFAGAGGVWFAVAAYHLLVSSQVGLIYALSMAFQCLGWGLLALYEWRVVRASVQTERGLA